MSSQYPRTVHDFFGFAECLYEVEYAAENKPEACAKIAEALDAAEIPWEFDGTRGYDFGCWSPVALIFPAADVPLIQVSLHSSLDEATHVRLGQALGTLRDVGYLLVCTGGVTHNLMDLSFGDDRLPPAAVGFDNWVGEVLKYEENRTQYEEVDEAWSARSARLCKWLDPDQGVFLAAQNCHPTPEHFLPLLVASGSGGPCSTVHHSWTYGCLSMASFMFGSMPSPDDPNLGAAATSTEEAPDDGAQTAGQKPTKASADEGQGTRAGGGGADILQLSHSGLDESMQAGWGGSQALDDSVGEPHAEVTSAADGRNTSMNVDHDIHGLESVVMRPRTASSRGSSRPASRELVRMAIASGVATEKQQFVQQIRRIERGESFRSNAKAVDDRLEPPPPKKQGSSTNKGEK
mmetsp:Transcript_23619/g.36919  ORF Transcript_23619/g.36919 Transcript_23619/m.36919 type:complete len:406 (-) Transcript_23619:181-1398(-)|eukprot:CAMPEP_0184314608 /NCGR_PEP_ID=MMETSP1049-20130417/75749_1 /TAXON_ID=77928 /ORGANISM="Proteomonas sulcata, Strain CCMP704" /LENGTH=405 /DNA_ID=CAMNT_0026632611 /DNA_START=256 /DNA_END=1473 /DNA_ORIENTATION=+